MTTRKPLTVINGKLSQFPVGDSPQMESPSLPVRVITAGEVTGSTGVIQLTATTLPGLLLVDLPSAYGSFSVELPTAASVAGRELTVVLRNPVDGSGLLLEAPVDYFEADSEQAAVALNATGERITCVSDGSTWRIVTRHRRGEGAADIAYSGWDSPVTLPTSLSNFSQLDALSAPLAVTLPLLAEVCGRRYVFYRCDSNPAHTCTLAAQAVDYFRNAAYPINFACGDVVFIEASTAGWTVTNRYNAAAAPGGGAQQVYVQPNDPGLAPGVPALWIQTGLGDGGQGFTFWIND